MTVAKGMVYTYNAENRLIETAPQNPQQGSIKSIYIYDYMGRRARKTFYTYSSGSWQKQKDISFIFDGWNMVKESEKTSDSSPEVPFYYVWGLDLSQSMQGAGGVGGLIASIKSGSEYLYFFDANGNVGQMVKVSDGSIAARYEYDPFGKTLFAEGAMAGENPYRFSTKYQDAETGLYYYGYRYYSVEFGRWINRDPMEENGGIHLYAFNYNNGLCVTDYLGLKGRVCGACCAENIIPRITADRTKMFSTPYFSHDFEWEISLSYKNDVVSGDCEFEWWEKSDQELNSGIIPNDEVFHNVTADVKRNTPSCVSDWLERQQPTPGNEIIKFTDSPYLQVTKPNPYKYGKFKNGALLEWNHAVKIVVKSTAGCTQCKYSSIEATIWHSFEWNGDRNLGDLKVRAGIEGPVYIAPVVKYVNHAAYATL